MTAYYNENDPYAAQWLRNLIAAGRIAPGVVDTRSIVDVLPSDLKGFTQCHFFAGIGVWSHALRMAAWSDERPVWTGSCPCQPFSAAGENRGFDDERHLWPHWHWLISYHLPAIVFGEQVANKSADPWIDLVQDDLEALDYAFGALPFPAASIGAPHIRDRLYWMGNTKGSRWASRKRAVAPARYRHPIITTSADDWMAHAGIARLEIERQQSARGERTSVERSRAPGRLGSSASEQTGLPGFAWEQRNTDWIECTDGKARPVEPGTFPLANGVTNRVGRLRGYGNAIVAPQAAEFISAFLDYERGVDLY